MANARANAIIAKTYVDRKTSRIFSRALALAAATRHDDKKCGNRKWRALSVIVIDRSQEPAPACLLDERTRRAREMLRAAFSSDTDVAAQTRYAMEGLAIVDQELQTSLERLFKGHCAFCERAVPTSAYRFRPTEEAGPTSDAPTEYGDRAHLYYTWLANSWSNIYPICSGCRPEEASIFPVRGKRCALPERYEIEAYVEQPTGSWRTQPSENPLLLDPSGDEDLRKHLLVLPDGRMLGLDERGAFTITHFGLDRGDVTKSRRSALSLYLERLTNGDGVAPSALFRYGEMLHGGAWMLLLYQLARRLGGGASRVNLSRKRIETYYLSRLRRPGFADELRAAAFDLNDDFEDLLGGRTRIQPVQSTHAPRPTHVTIRNFKSIEALDLALPNPPSSAPGDLTRASTLIILGENATGKSSILEAIALALGSQQQRRALKQEAARYMLQPAYLGGDGPARGGSIEITYEDDFIEHVQIAPGWPRNERQQEERPRLPVFAYGAYRLFTDAVRRDGSGYRVRSLLEPGHVLSNPETWLASLYDKPEFAEVVRALRSILAVDQAFEVIERDERGAFVLSIATELANGIVARVHTPLDALSSGFRAVLAMACDIMRGLLDAQDSRSPSLARARGIVLIDEVEAHLHPRWKMRIMTGLRQSLPGVSFIVTTHDPLCLRGVATHEVVALRRRRRPSPASGELPETVEILSDLPEIDMLTLEQLLTSDLFNLFSTDASDAEDSLARTADLVALERADRLQPEDVLQLGDLRTKLRAQVRRSIPIGSTRVEQLIQEAVEQFLAERRATRSEDLGKLQDHTRSTIAAALAEL